MNLNNMNNRSGSMANGGISNEELSNGDPNILNGPNGRLKKGPWTAAEDSILRNHVRLNGEGNWNAVQKMTGLARCGKSCRLRWTNHLRPHLRKGPFSPKEEFLIMKLHAKFGNKWARIATHLEGRTDNEIKNYWNTRLKRRQHDGLPHYRAKNECDSHKFNKNMSMFPNNRNPNLNTVLLKYSSPFNFSKQDSNVIGLNRRLNQNFQDYQQFSNNMQKEMPLLNYGFKIGHNQGQFRPNMDYGMTNFGTNLNNMIPNNFGTNLNHVIPNSFPNLEPGLCSNNLYHDQTSVPRPGGIIMNNTMFHVQQGGNFQNLQKMQVLPSLPQLVRVDSNSNWSNCNSIYMGANNGDMNKLGIETGHPSKWTGLDCFNGESNDMLLNSEVHDEADVQRWIEELSNLINQVTDEAQLNE